MGATIRGPVDGDTGAIAGIHAPTVQGAHFSFETTPPSAAETADRIRETPGRFPRVVREYGGTVPGYAYASQPEDRPAYRWSPASPFTSPSPGGGWPPVRGSHSLPIILINDSKRYIEY